MWAAYYGGDEEESLSYKECIYSLICAYDQLINLKALFLADESNDHGERRWEYKRYKIQMDETSVLLEAYPKLEVLRLQGKGCLDFSHPIKHNCLKTLIIETKELEYQTLEKIIMFNLPQLEYLELWLGRDYDYKGKRYRDEKNDLDLLTDLLMPLLFEDSFPKLKYFGFCGCEWADDFVAFFKNSPILERLRILNLTRGSLSDEGAEILLNTPAINQLHTLDVSMNILSPEMANKLSELNCNVISEPQDRGIYYPRMEKYGACRYSSVYE